jgi:3-deoxy-D-manno-octulosonic acid kinase
MYWQSLLNDPVLSDFLPLVDGRARALVRRGLESSAPLLGLRGDPTSGDVVHGGRAGHPVVALPDGTRAVVRRYHRGGAVRHVNRATYFAGHRAFEELRATERARAAGVRVPEVLAATERRRALGYEAWLATRWIDGAVEAAAWLKAAEGANRSRGLREAGQQIGRMHAAGIDHPDLNLRNLLVVDRPDGDEESDVGGTIVYLIDFDGARMRAGPLDTATRAKDLRRLARSARKLGIRIGSEGWGAMREGYGAGWPLPDAELADLG